MKSELEVISVSHSRQSGTRERQVRTEASRRNTRKRKQQLRRFYYGVGSFLCILILILTVGIVKTIQAKSNAESGSETATTGAAVANQTYVKIAENYQPNQPKSMAESEILLTLKSLAEEYPEFQSIYEQSELYPEKMLLALCNNPEMYEFVKGYPEADNSEAGEISSQELKEECPLFLQWDKRWGYISYGDSMIGLAGCGPTCLSMVVVGLTGEESATPADVAAYSMSNGYYVEGTGTAWSLMTEGASHYGITAKEIALDEGVMKNYLDWGYLIICSVGPGDFTSAGHFIVIYGYDEEGFKVNDPNCVARSSKRWTYGELSGQIKILWAYSK